MIFLSLSIVQATSVHWSSAECGGCQGHGGAGPGVQFWSCSLSVSLQSCWDGPEWRPKCMVGLGQELGGKRLLVQHLYSVVMTSYNGYWGATNFSACGCLLCCCMCSLSIVSIISPCHRLVTCSHFCLSSDMPRIRTWSSPYTLQRYIHISIPKLYIHAMVTSVAIFWEYILKMVNVIYLEWRECRLFTVTG